jgi:drug/metabolite transporter (DMT)-like permease
LAPGLEAEGRATATTAERTDSRTGVTFAVGSAVLFGASPPFAKLLLGQVEPVLLAGLLYLGSGVGLSIWRPIRSWMGKAQEGRLKRADLPWLAGAVFFGGVAGPMLLMLGLVATAASTASLLLNLEGVFTALLAWFVFKENFDRRIALGMAAITAGGVLVSRAGSPELGVPWGPLAIAGACLCWAIDNNLTRKVSGGDPVQIGAVKGLVAGPVNLAIAFVAGAKLPSILIVLEAGAVGFLCYGVSLTLFVLALRHLGTARTGAYFSLAPFVGAAVSVLVFWEIPGVVFLAAVALMSVGVWLHLTERHEHEHQHEEMIHDHRHFHDAHHQHEHAPTDPPGEPHSHAHRHAPLRHRHPHYPDIHHRHTH